ncbi:MAG: hypothetical protein AUJ70_03640 [Candidatus Omnitrophica bacterium CG1_02_40_15]|nr:MAG: hypothetical protein AUJ70_03640 [Candidatus Omnitrophica bacterium CG1_02_40_15]
MKFNPDSQRFISQAKKAVEELKPRIYSKELLDLDRKEAEFSSQKLDTAEYIKYLLDSANMISSRDRSKNIDNILFERGAEGTESRTAKYKNIFLLKETMEMEKHIDQPKIMTESANLILNLQAKLRNENLKTDLDALMARAKLFNDQKTSPFSFYSYLKDLALKHIRPGLDGSDESALSSRPGLEQKYPELMNFIEYLTKVNSLDSTKLFLELENLNFEIKENIAKTDEQKLLIKASRNINFLENFFNLKVSNEDLDYYVNHRDEHKIGFFKDFLSPTIKKYNINAFIDYNPALIDNHLQELEEFYKVVKDRDIAMVNNSLSEITKRDVKLATLVHGGFHTKGITSLLREKGYSYIIVSPYSKTDMDEENYHFLLQGRRKPITELLQKLDLSKIIKNLMNSPETLRINLGFDEDMETALRDEVMPQLNKEWGTNEKLGSLKQRMAQAIITAGPDKVEKWNQLAATGFYSFEVKGLEEGIFIFKYTFMKQEVEYIVITKDKAWMAKKEEIASFDSAPQIGKGFAKMAVSPVPNVLAIDAFYSALSANDHAILDLVIKQAQDNVLPLQRNNVANILAGTYLAKPMPNNEDPAWLLITIGMDRGLALTLVDKVKNMAADVRNAVPRSVSASTDTLMPMGLSYEVKQEEVSRLSQVTIYSNMLEGFLDPDQASTKMEGLVEYNEESLMGFMRKVFEVGAEQINNLDGGTRKRLLKGFYDLFEQAGKKDVTFYLAPEEFVGKGVYMRRVKIEGQNHYGVLVNKAYYNTVSAVLAKIRVAEKSGTVLSEYSELMKKAVYYTVFERVMHELLENEKQLEQALALSDSTSYENKKAAIREAINDMETRSFTDVDAVLYVYLCYGAMAGRIKLVRDLLKDGSESDRKLARTILGPNKYGKLERLFNRWGRRAFLAQVPLIGEFKSELWSNAAAFVGETYARTITAVADNRGVNVDAILAALSKEMKTTSGLSRVVYDKFIIELAKQAKNMPLDKDMELVVEVNEPVGGKHIETYRFYVNWQFVLGQFAVRALSIYLDVVALAEGNTTALNYEKPVVVIEPEDVQKIAAEYQALTESKTLASQDKILRDVLVDDVFAIRASKMMTLEEKLKKMRWVTDNPNRILLVLVSTLDEYRAVEDIKDVNDRVHLVVLVGDDGLTDEDVQDAGIDSQYLYKSTTPGLQELFAKAADLPAPTSLTKVLDDSRDKADAVWRQI